MALYVNAILWSIPYPRRLSRALAQAGFSRWTLASGGIFFSAAAVLFAAATTVRLGRLSRSRALAILFGALVYAALIVYLSPVPDEIVHVGEYGILAILFWLALGSSAGPARPWLAVAATGAVGFLDEITQGVTPGRFFDWRDVLVNLISGALPLWLSLVSVRSER